MRKVQLEKPWRSADNWLTQFGSIVWFCARQLTIQNRTPSLFLASQAWLTSHYVLLTFLHFVLFFKWKRTDPYNLEEVTSWYPPHLWIDYQLWGALGTDRWESENRFSAWGTWFSARPTPRSCVSFLFPSEIFVSFQCYISGQGLLSFCQLKAQCLTVHKIGSTPNVNTPWAVCLKSDFYIIGSAWLQKWSYFPIGKDSMKSPVVFILVLLLTGSPV